MVDKKTYRYLINGDYLIASFSWLPKAKIIINKLALIKKVSGFFITALLLAGLMQKSVTLTSFSAGLAVFYTIMQYL